MKQLYLNDFFRHVWAKRDAFTEVQRISGDVFREVKNRKTLRFEIAEHGFFLKYHTGVGYREIFKNLLQFKRPVLGARNEFEAIQRLHALQVGTMTVAAFGERNWSPAQRESFLITEELTGMTTLEDLTTSDRWKSIGFDWKLALLRNVATIAGKLRDNGINHRDFYLCHFMLREASLSTTPPAPALFVIDLHRAQIRKKVPYRYLVKDTAGLWFSSMDAGLTRHDIYRFLKIWSGKPLRQTLQEDEKFYRDVDRTARKLYCKVHRKNPPESTSLWT